mmetsp:Transcript_6543/g.14264  ORF Transcript_6543/g.14264 Transcript_6543/m.14264 type:complete len:342 (+) Transcript_6543:172-1197(+)
MSSSINKNVNVERRTWDKETFEARARTRAAAELTVENNGASSSAAADPLTTGNGDDETTSIANNTSAIKNSIEPTVEKEEFLPAQSSRAGPMGSDRAFLKSRSRKVDLESKLGSSEIIDPAAAVATKSKSSLVDDINSDICGVAGAGGGPLTPSSGVSKCTDGVGWHCRVCDCFLKDSLTYLDHINGRKHQRYLGYSMRVEKSTTEEVSGVLKGLAEKKRERNVLGLGGLGSAKSQVSATEIDFEDVVRKKDEEALRRKADRARRREERKRRGKKKEANNYGSSGQVNLVTAVEEKQVVETENPAGGKVDGEEEDDDDEGGGIDPALAAMMGFSGFGGSRK